MVNEKRREKHVSFDMAKRVKEISSMTTQNNKEE
jgi:hypothetical protein